MNITQTASRPDQALEDRILARRMAALSHPVRIAILRQLAADGSCCCKEVVGRIDLAQSTVSQHLKILVEAGLVQARPDRQRSCYRLDNAAMAQFAATFAGMVESCCASGSCGEGTDHG
jgi:DNA-binding transcriptional ArsR family regulator